ncbi:MAG: hypothetical protein EOR96_11150 [Mesorhizobium sp.]|uniref:Propionyl-coenzyme A carboxylase alpha polypeptide n=1 Tax=Mesorhizobium mediterraneum TaxID=43617 RepID=A0AB36RCR4_9HYPH|nr:hypothetical protein CIT25_13785 [Mesorhizobium mediterraneum]RWN41651.1 MAG: hypothetical protein EOR96_11150 [Mesorhizobium sp.]TIU07757.1 MAG: hypothetical protein E5W40_17245 [Mesorhizobium sp.]
MDPHPNPPHKGEGTLPRASTLVPKVRQFVEVSASGSLLPPCGKGLGVGVHRRAKAVAFHLP